MSVPIFSSGMRNAKTQRARINVEKAQEERGNLTSDALNIQTGQNIKSKIPIYKEKYLKL